MKPRTAIALVVLLLMAGVCVRLGIWQLSRLEEKRALNAELRAVLARPPRLVEIPLAPVEALRDRRVQLHGLYDESHQFLLAGRSHDGSPGVHVLTPLVLDIGDAVLVDRGWIHAGDAATARPERWPEPGPREVLGLAEPLAPARKPEAYRRLPIDSLDVWSSRTLDADSVRARLPYRVASWWVRQLPGPGVPADPVREPAKPYEEFTHISYAAQWFLFATILLAGPLFVRAARRRRARVGGPDAEPELYRADAERHPNPDPE